MALTNLKHSSIKILHPSVARALAQSYSAECVVADPAIRGIMIFVEVTALASTPSVVPTLEIYSRVGDEWIILKAFTAITNVTGTGNYVYFVYPEPLTDPSSGADVDEIFKFPIPTHFRFSMVHGDTDSMTYSTEISCLR